jgi:hypothetical protein
MSGHRFVTEDRSVEATEFGDVRVLVNYGDRPYDENGVQLPRYGVLVEAPTFVAFHATRYAGIDDPRGMLFTVRSLDGLPLGHSKSVRVWHGFGDPRIRLRGKLFTVERETVISLQPEGPR